MATDIALVYMVAGLSSRFGGKIKQFAKVGKNGETLIEISMRQAMAAEFTKIIFIVGKMTEKRFKDEFGEKYAGIPIYYAVQDFNEKNRDKPWGTGDSLCSAKKYLDCPFVVCNGDDLYGQSNFARLTKHLKESNDEASIGYLLKDTLPSDGTVTRAIFESQKGNVKRIGEAFSISIGNLNVMENELCCMNIFALHPQTLGFLSNALEDFKRDKKTDRKAEFLLHSGLSALIEKGKISMKLYPSEDSWIGITNPEDEENVREYLKSS